MLFKIKKLIKKRSLEESRTGLLKKIVLGYLIIILLPTVLFTVMLQSQFHNRMINEYAKQKQQFLERAHTNLRLDLTKLESVHDFFQYNANLVEYLSGFYTSDAETVYSFIKYIEPLVSFVTVGVPSIADIKFYHYDQGEHILSLGSLIFNAKILDDIETIKDIMPDGGRGIWSYKPDQEMINLPRLTYYQEIFDKDFEKSIGFIKITAKSGVLLNFANDLRALGEGYDSIVILGENGDILYERTGNEITLSDEDKRKLTENMDFDASLRMSFDDGRYLINSISMPVLNMRAVMFQNENTILGGINLYLNGIIFYVLGLFALLSATYYFITTNITTRILRLARHMHGIDDKNLVPYGGKKGKDEIGFLINMFNSMILRIEELILNVHRTELLRKEAAYAALQAQIKPHFLYGTLESIRMLAESQNASDVSNAIYTFGRLIRYSLSSDKNEVYLTDELEHVRNYLEIHKLRMGDRLEYLFEINIDIKALKCPPFILQPLVENSIIHGIYDSRNKGLIKLSVNRVEQHVIITVYDNGVGVSENKLKTIRDMLENRLEIKDFQTNISGFALYNISERIKSYYGNDSRLIFSSTQGEGTDVTLFLQKFKSDKNIF